LKYSNIPVSVPSLHTVFATNGRTPSYINLTQVQYLRTVSKQQLCSAEKGSDKKEAINDQDKSTVQPETNTEADKPVGEPEKLSVFKRFKKTYKEHGKVLIGVHLFTSSIWFGSFYFLAKT